jgi:hypothetical protein
MTIAPPAGVVVDTMVISWLFDERPNPVAERYRDLIGPAPVLLAFQTVMELRYGGLRAGWGTSQAYARAPARGADRLTARRPDDARLRPTAR